VTRVAVAWDIDGTLIDSEPLHLEALQAVCDRYGLDIRGLADEAFRGVHMFDVWAALSAQLPADLDRDGWIAEISDTYVDRADSLTVQPGAVDVIAALSARGIKQVCVSNSNRQIVDANIKALGIERFLEFSISFDDVSVGKPDPEPYLSACDRLGYPPDRVIGVEDSRAGARAARAAGLIVIGYSPSGEPLGDIDVMIARLSEIPPLLSVAMRLRRLADVKWSAITAPASSES
jgi:HAD superfamily hydrolase (TIGR01509 family)